MHELYKTDYSKNTQGRSDPLSINRLQCSWMKPRLQTKATPTTLARISGEEERGLLSPTPSGRPDTCTWTTLRQVKLFLHIIWVQTEYQVLSACNKKTLRLHLKRIWVQNELTFFSQWFLLQDLSILLVASWGSLLTPVKIWFTMLL